MNDPRLYLSDNARILVLTGAGVSAESGLATFRGAGGLWAGKTVESVASPRGFAADPDMVWRFYGERRAAAAAAAPNAGHRALAELESRLGDRFLLVTQNVDGLHARAGSQRTVEIHGSLWRSRCSRCQRPVFTDSAQPKVTPVCELCGGNLRPDIVWFGEELEPAHIAQIRSFIKGARKERQFLYFLAIGTSGAVWPANTFVDWVRQVQGSTWLVNLDPPENSTSFHRFVQGPAGVILPDLFEFPL